VPEAGNAGPSVAAAAVAAWEQANAALVAGLAPVRDVVVAEGLLSGLTGEQEWGAGLPPDLKLASDPATLAQLIGRADYLVAGSTGAATRWTGQLAGCRALVLPDQVDLRPEDLGSVRQFVAAGGVLIAFGHASLLGAEGKPQADYALADLFGAHYAGPVTFTTEATRVSLSADSTYAPIYGPEKIIDGAADTFWASREGGPMPHWVQITFTAPRTVARAVVKCRPGFLLTDFEVQCQAGDQWPTAAKVTGNEDSAVDCPFERPAETGAVRLFITKEMLNGADRQIADVGEVTLYDATGRPLIVPPYLIAAQIKDAAWAKANRSSRLMLRSPAVKLRTEKAQVLASFSDPLGGGELPFCTLGKAGKGRAYLLTVPEAALGTEPEDWEALLRCFVGMPSLRHSGDGGVFAFLSRGRAQCLLQLVDTAPTDTPDRAKEVIVRANTRALGPIGAALLVPGDTALAVAPRGEWVQFTAPLKSAGAGQPPRASILLRKAR